MIRNRILLFFGILMLFFIAENNIAYANEKLNIEYKANDETKENIVDFIEQEEEHSPILSNGQNPNQYSVEYINDDEGINIYFLKNEKNIMDKECLLFDNILPDYYETYFPARTKTGEECWVITNSSDNEINRIEYEQNMYTSNEIMEIADSLVSHDAINRVCLIQLECMDNMKFIALACNDKKEYIIPIVDFYCNDHCFKTKTLYTTEELSVPFSECYHDLFDTVSDSNGNGIVLGIETDKEIQNITILIRLISVIVSVSIIGKLFLIWRGRKI